MKIFKKLIRILFVFIFSRCYRFYAELKGFINRIGVKEKTTIFKKPDCNTKTICIFYGYQKFVNVSLEKQLEDLALNNFYIIYVTNLQLSEDMKNFLSTYCQVLIERPNYGRDMAGYKSGFLFIQRPEFSSVVELIFMNDTILYPIFDSYLFWQNLRGLDGDIVAPFGSYQIEYHLQSFLMLCKNSAHKNPNFINYWENYKSPNTRQMAIHQGELGFSRHMLKVGFSLNSLINPFSISKDINENKINKSFIPNNYFKYYGKKKNFLLSAFQDGNPSHIFSLIGLEYYAIPLLKKDLVSRNTVSLVEIFSKINNYEIKIPAKELQQQLLIKWRSKNSIKLIDLFLNFIGEL